MIALKRSEQKVNEQLNLACEWEEAGGSAVPGSSFEAGVRAAIEWMIGDREEEPIEEAP